MKKIAVVFVLLVLFALLFLFLSNSAENKVPEKESNLSLNLLEIGYTQKYGYAVVNYSGYGTVKLLKLLEPPKSKIVLLKKDYLTTDRYPSLKEDIESLKAYGFSVFESEKIDFIPSNTIMIIPSGAMPSYILKNLSNYSFYSNHIIYIGKSDLLAEEEKIIQSDWYGMLSKDEKKAITVINLTLSELYEKDRNLLPEMLINNSWALNSSKTVVLNGTGKKTLFLPVDDGYFRLVAGRRIYDPKERFNYSVYATGKDEIFLWNRADIVINTNETRGILNLIVEKDGKEIKMIELERGRNESFFVSLKFNETGDYLLKFVDRSGMVGAKYLKVKDINIFLKNAYGTTYEFSVLVNNEPLEKGYVNVSLEHSNKTITFPVYNGIVRVRALLPKGKSTFVFELLGTTKKIVYENIRESLVEFYAKYLSIGFFFVVIVFLLARLLKRPTYIIKLPPGSTVRNQEIRVKTKDIIKSINEIEKRFGWKKVPLSIKEIGAGIKAVLTEGKEVNEGDVEAIMKKLEEKGIAESYLGYYQLKGWGDVRRNVLKRILRDKLIEYGIHFEEIKNGFKTKNWNYLIDFHSVKSLKKGTILVFENEKTKEEKLNSLKPKERARLNILIKNGELKLVLVSELDDVL